MNVAEKLDLSSLCRLAKEREKEIVEKIESEKTEDDELATLKTAFKAKVDKLKKTTKQKLWLEAEKEVPEDMLGRGLNVKIEYSKKLLKHLNKRKDKFPEKVVKELSFIKEIALEV